MYCSRSSREACMTRMPGSAQQQSSARSQTMVPKKTPLSLIVLAAEAFSAEEAVLWCPTYQMVLTLTSSQGSRCVLHTLSLMLATTRYITCRGTRALHQSHVPRAPSTMLSRHQPGLKPCLPGTCCQAEGRNQMCRLEQRSLTGQTAHLYQAPKALLPM